MPNGAIRTQLYAAWLREGITRTYGALAHGYQEKLALASGVSRDTIWRILRGRSIPSRQTVSQLAAALGISPPSEQAESTKVIPGRVSEPAAVERPVLTTTLPTAVPGPGAAARVAESPGSGYNQPPGEGGSHRLDAEEIRMTQHALNEFLQVTLIENETDRQADGLLTLVELLDRWAEAAREMNLDAKIIDEVRRQLLRRRRGEPPLA